MDTPVREILNGTFVKSIAVSNNRAVVGAELSGADDGIHLFDLDSGQPLQTLKGPLSSGVASVAISPNGQHVAASTQGVEALLWNVATGQLMKSAPGPAAVSDNNSRIAFSPDGKFILASFFGDLTIFDTELNQKSKFRVHLDGGSVFAMAPSPDGRFLAAGYVRFDSGLDMVVFDLISQQISHRFIAGNPAGVTCIAWTGSHILTGSGNGTVKLWSAQFGTMVRTFPQHSKPVNAVAVSPDGRLALSGSDDLTMKVLEVATGKELHSFSHADGQVTAVAFANGSKTAVSCSGKSLKVWDLSGL